MKWLCMSAAMTRDDVCALLRREIEKHGTAKAWADAHGLSPSYVSDVLNGNRRPAGVILAALGLEKAVAYQAIPK